MQEKIIKFIKKEMKRQKISQKQIAFDTCFSQAHVSRLLQKETTNSQGLHKILDILGYDYTELEAIYEKTSTQFRSFYEALYMLDEDSCLEILQESKSMIERYIFITDERFYVEVSLMKHLYQIINDPNEINLDDYLKLEKSIHSLSDEQKAIYHDYLGAFYEIRKKYTRAPQHFEKALSYAPSIKVTAMIYYHKGMLYEQTDDYDLAIVNTNNALHIFRGTGNIKRSLSCELHITNIYARNNRVSLAKEQYTQILSRSKTSHDYDLMIRCYSNLAYLANKEGEYQEALGYLSQLESHTGHLTPTHTLRKLEALLGLKRQDAFNEVYNKSVKIFKKETAEYSKLLIYKYHNDKNLGEDYYTQLRHHINEYRETDDYERILEIYNYLIDYASESRNLGIAAKYKIDKLDFIEARKFKLS